MPGLVGRIWVGSVTCLIGFIAYTSQIFIIWPWYGREFSVELLKLIGPFNILVLMVYWNYFLTVRTDPGRVSPSWKPDFGSGEPYEVKKLTGGPRYCRYCSTYKPPRAHHCKQCKRCVLRMDHHCPWVDNCVGHYNHGHFIRFLFFVDVACSYHLIMVTRRVIDSVSPTSYYHVDPTTADILFVVFNYTACIPVIMAVGFFSIYHFYCLCTNTTTIEGWEKDKVATLIRRGKIREIKFPYNLGLLANVRAVLGENPLLWLWPQPMRGSGLHFKVAEGADSDVQHIWPPKDPSVYDHPNGPDLTGKSPFTYGTGLNPDLLPSNNARLRHPKSKDLQTPGVGNDSAPYGHNFDEEDRKTTSTPSRNSFSSNEYPDNRGFFGRLGEERADDNYDNPDGPTVRVRRGSEGWEVRPMSKDEIVQRYLRSRGLEPEQSRIRDAETGNEVGGPREMLNKLNEPGRYNRYVPEVQSSSEDEDQV
ncbi:Palmitoyltransferase [Tulasnella sp. 418]|nr:Palmitoyltransferase [Tulasnella sp. 418]